MKKLFIILTLIILFIYACGYTNEIEYTKCNKQTDCPEGKYCSSLKRCQWNQCGENSNCGKGKCVETPNGAKCECHEDSVWFAERKLCLPTCSGYSEECTEFGKTTDFDSCNMTKGHCDTNCEGEGSCPANFYCSSGGACRRNEG